MKRFLVLVQKQYIIEAGESIRNPNNSASIDQWRPCGVLKFANYSIIVQANVREPWCSAASIYFSAIYTALLVELSTKTHTYSHNYKGRFEGA